MRPPSSCASRGAMSRTDTSSAGASTSGSRPSASTANSARPSCSPSSSGCAPASSSGPSATSASASASTSTAVSAATTARLLGSARRSATQASSRRRAVTRSRRAPSKGLGEATTVHGSHPAAMPRWAPEPPVPLPSGCVHHVPGRGEMFLRDTGGDGPPVLLLHGWMFSADLNWYRTYAPLAEAGYRVLAVDHRGHGRGLRSADPFTLRDCADDAAALLAHLQIPPALAVGYSMGGPIASLMARDHPQWVSGLVLGATAMDWSEPRMKAFWRTMAGLRLLMGLAPEAIWRRGLKASGFPESAITTWTAAELSRGNSVDIAEAGRELGRYDSSAWIAGIDAPGAVIITTQDTGVPPSKQRALAAAMSAPEFYVRGDHSAVITHAERFNEQLLAALAAVRDPRPAPAP